MAEENLAVVDELIQDLKAGVPLVKAFKARESALSVAPGLHGQLSRTIRLARTLGASPIDAFERVLAVRRMSKEFESELESEWATPRATMRLVVWLPVGFIAFAQLLGLPIVQAVLNNLLARISVAAGIALLLVARLWSKRILLRASPITNSLAEEVDLVALAMSSGLSFDKALDRAGVSTEVGPLLSQERLLARCTGAPIAKLILGRADLLRQQTQRANRLRVKEAAVTLMWPLGVAVLPALILLLVIPLTVGFASPAAQ